MPARRLLMIETGGRGGVTDYTDQLVRALAAEGVEVELATASDHLYGPMPPNVHVTRRFGYLRGGTPVREALRRMNVHKLVNGASYVKAVLALMPAARRNGIVHFQGFALPPLGIAVMLLMRLSGAAVVLTPHNTFDRGRGFFGARALMMRLPQALIVHTQFDVGQLPPAARPRAAVIPHGDYGPLADRVAAGDRDAARAVLGIPGDATVALCFGQLRPDKGIVDVVRAAQEVEELWVLLAGQDLGALDEVRPLLDADPGLARRVVLRPGFASLEDAASFFAAADVSVLAYRHASMSGVLLLGYGFARPAAVYPVGGLPEGVRDGETGWVVPRADVPALVATLRDVVATGPEERLARGHAGQRMARETYGWSSIARQTVAVYAELDGGGPRDGPVAA